MSDLSPEQTDGGKRPAAIVGLVFLIFVGAIVQFISAVIAIVLAIRPGEEQQFFSQPVSDWYWVMTAILSFILGLIYIWIARGLLARDPQSWILVNVLALINFFFALFELPTGNGWTVLFINIVILLLNNTGETKRWVRLE